MLSFLSAPQPRRTLLQVIAALVGGLPFSVYNLWLTRSHPQLAVWNAQNLTWTPAAWDVLLALSPAFLLALYGARRALQARAVALYPVLAWAAAAFLLIYLPVDLQRRFMIGLSLPLVALAAFGPAGVSAERPARSRRLASLGLGLALPSTLIMLLVLMFGILKLDSKLYLTQDEWRSLAWLAENSPPDALALASPQMGLLIPAHTGRRVIYGHDYETPHAAAEKAAVEDFYAGRLADQATFLAARRVDFVFYGPRERELGALPAGLPLAPVFSSGEVSVYRVVATP